MTEGVCQNLNGLRSMFSNIIIRVVQPLLLRSLSIAYAQSTDHHNMSIAVKSLKMIPVVVRISSEQLKLTVAARERL